MYVVNNIAGDYTQCKLPLSATKWFFICMAINCNLHSLYVLMGHNINLAWWF